MCYDLTRGVHNPTTGRRGKRRTGKIGDFMLHRLDGEGIPTPSFVAPEHVRQRDSVLPLAQEYAANLSPEQGAQLAPHLGLPRWVSEYVPLLGWKAQPRGSKGKSRSAGAWSFPEYDGEGRVVGIHFRSTAGEKWQERDTSRGLAVPAGWQDRSGPVFLVEGWSDVLAMSAAGLPAIGRPSNVGGVDDLAQLLRHVAPDRQIVVVGENDLRRTPKSASRRLWPGRTGAIATARQLAAKMGRPISWCIAPAVVPDTNRNAKDARDWLKIAIAREAKGSERRDRWQNIGAKFANDLLSTCQIARTLPVEQPEKKQERRCHCTTNAVLQGKPATNVSDNSGVAAFKCRRWTCEECHDYNQNRWLAWLYRCVGAWADELDPIITNAPLVRKGELDHAPDHKDVGGWNIYAAIVHGSQFSSIGKRLRSRNTRQRIAVEYAVVKIGDCEIPERYRGLVNEKEPRSTRRVKSSRLSRALVIVALDPASEGEEPAPKVLKLTPAQQAVELLEWATEQIPLDLPDGKKRHRPFTTSSGWKMPEPEPGRWNREGLSAFPVSAVEDLIRRLRIQDTEAAVHAETVQAQALWSKENFAAFTELLSAMLREMLKASKTAPKPDIDELEARFLRWRMVIEQSLSGVASGSFSTTGILFGVLQEMVHRLPTMGDSEKLIGAAMTDHELLSIDLPYIRDFLGSLWPPPPEKKPKRQRKVRDDKTDTPEFDKIKDTIGQ
ncbi:hypothetical protein [Gemmata obscuriglobus]|uniref:hypothetical protein n=1 Tax=Gemmata obscuriglobus TaxID=114 RepID=UPI0011CDAB24|nr:hypothetical protein [Gemmata obscuriglobus]